MKKYTLIKFYKGESTNDEIDSIINWVNKSPLNKEYFARLKALYTATYINAINITPNNNVSFKKPSGHRHRILYASSAAAIAALFFTMGYFLSNIGKQGEFEPAITVAQAKAPLIRTLYTEKGVKGFIQLPDSSKVWLNSDSRITYPDEFTGGTRAVKISGEAYFEVTKDSLHPMIVQTNKNFSIEVLGTKFNVRSYENDAKAEATLYTGAITMHYKNTKTEKIETLALKPSQSFTYITAENIPKPFKYKEPEKQSAWKNGQLVFDNTPMDEALKILERWHGTKFIINNPNIYKYKLSAEFSSESIVQVLEIMQLIMPFKYNYTNNVVTINKTYIAPPVARM